MLYVLLLILVFAIVSYTLLYKLNIKRLSTIQFGVGVYLYGFVFAALLALLMIPFGINPYASIVYIDVEGWSLLIVRGMLSMLVTVAWTNTLRALPLSIAEPVFQSVIFPVFVIGWLVFGDAVVWYAIILLVAIVAGSTILGLSGNNKQSNKTHGKGIFWLLVTIACGTALGTVGRRLADIGLDAVLSAAVVSLVGLIPNIILMRWDKNKEGVSCIKATTKKALLAPITVLMAAIYVARFWASFEVVTEMNIGVMQAILQAATAIIVVLSVWIWKERLSWYGWIAVGIIIVSSVALSLWT